MVLAVRGLGLRGNPGFGFASILIFTIDGAGLTGKVVVVTDGHVSGLVNKTLLVCEISPEAANGGPLALVANGDVISIDARKRVVNLEAAEDELAERRKHMKNFLKQGERGWLSIYQRCVSPMSKGAVLVE